MATRVGSKGQVVIDGEIRKRLGVAPGMLAIQRLVGDHVELRFVPGQHQRSLAGAARPHINRFPSQGELEDLDEVWSSNYALTPASDSGS